MAADDNSYVITIKYETADNKKSPVAGGNGSAQSGSGESEGGAVSTGKAVAKGLVTYNHYVKPFVNQAIQHRISTVTLRTGGEELESRLSFTYSVVQRAVGFAESVAVGAAVGHLPGALIGAAVSLVSMGIEFSNKQEAMLLQRSNENISLGFMNARAGGAVASFSNSRTSRQ